MTKKILAGAVASALALAALPAGATDWNKQMQLCAAAVEAGGYATIQDYDVKFISAGARRLKIELVPAAGGDSMVAECKISRGKVTEVNVQA